MSGPDRVTRTNTNNKAKKINKIIELVLEELEEDIKDNFHTKGRERDEEIITILR